MTSLRINQLIQRNAFCYPAGFFVRPKIPIQTLQHNTQGIDYYVGDIHGEYSLLEEALTKVGFDYSKDRLITVGDLIDRGNESIRVLEFLQQPWFYTVLGNHDYFLIEAAYHLALPETQVGAMVFQTWMNNGGDWVDGHTIETILKIAEYMLIRPLMLNVEQPNGFKVGVVHAELPLGMQWEETKQRLTVEVENKKLEPVAMRSLLWGRERILLHKKYSGDVQEYIKQLPRSNIKEGNKDYAALKTLAMTNIKDIDLLVCGHTAIKGGYSIANIRHIDEAVIFRKDKQGFNLRKIIDNNLLTLTC